MRPTAAITTFPRPQTAASVPPQAWQWRRRGRAAAPAPLARRARAGAPRARGGRPRGSLAVLGSVERPQRPLFLGLQLLFCQARSLGWLSWQHRRQSTVPKYAGCALVCFCVLLLCLPRVPSQLLPTLLTSFSLPSSCCFPYCLSWLLLCMLCAYSSCSTLATTST